MSKTLLPSNGDEEKPKVENPKWNLSCNCNYNGPCDDLGMGPFCPQCGRYVFETPTPDWALKVLTDILMKEEHDNEKTEPLR